MGDAHAAAALTATAQAPLAKSHCRGAWPPLERNTMFQTFDTSGGPGHVAERLKALRAHLSELGVDALLVPRADEHQGEYVPAAAERLKWLTGFSGSAGIAIVTRKSACLFTDGRYTVQAKAETDTNAFEISLTPRAQIAEWLIANLVKGQTLGFDPWLHTSSEISRLTATLSAKGIKLKSLAKNPIDLLWAKARPKLPSGQISIQPITLSGRSAQDKITQLQKQLKDEGQHSAILTLPDSICWLFNIRGTDVAHNPVVLAFAIVPASGKSELFIDPQKVGKDAKAHLAPIARLSQIKELRDRLKELRAAKRRVRLDSNSAAYWFEQALGSANVANGPDLCIQAKAIKTAAEIAGTRAAHLRDGAAVVRFLAWVDDTAEHGILDEISAVEKLEEFRRETGALLDISFPTISGAGPNGAIVHYRVTDKTNRRIEPGELFLVDSGGQYRDGTTDITRTIAIGKPSDEMRQRFTAVLRGHIAIASARFPKGTRGIDLDPFARRALWDMAADYDHGTGHGIGSYLSVHEGPQSISRAGMATLQPGMLLSNEPGFYKEGAFGIRIENVVLVTEPQAVPSGGGRAMMSFETLTLVPIDRRLIIAEALTAAERNWLNAYHARVYAVLANSLDAATRKWLYEATLPIARFSPPQFLM
jgi:Xaa-Pro aminopeptidase